MKTSSLLAGAKKFMRCRNILVAAMINACLASHPAAAGSGEWCSDLNVNVSVGKKWDSYKQQMIISTSAAPGQKSIDYQRDRAFVRIQIEYSYASAGSLGSRSGEGDAQIQIKTPWGSFSQAQMVFSPGPVTDVRIRDAYCLPWTHGG
jgi:hypothetical protein